MTNCHDLFSTCRETVNLIHMNSIVHLNVDSIIVLTFHNIFESVVKSYTINSNMHLLF